MTFLDSSVIIDYLDNVEHVVEFVDDQPTLLTSSICVYEVLIGEVFSSGSTDINGTREDFGRVASLEFNESIALEAVQLQQELQRSGDTMPARDLFVAATARSTGDELVVADADFQTMPLEDLMTVTNLWDS
ncbi:PIN domain-containing protein [Halorientalis salina]|uniref:PIN domain-containing protein n=1 Tax=Halorientalis salina TaxID=2932266 RepID=UPI0010AC8874|nr:PIN domain-containing protein [Halorientalis salina]